MFRFNIIDSSDSRKISTIGRVYQDLFSLIERLLQIRRGRSVLSMARPEQPSIPHHELSKADVVAPIIETSANKKRRKHTIKDGKT